MIYIRVSKERLNPAFGYTAELMKFGQGTIKVLAKSLNRKKVVQVAKAEAKERGLMINPSFEEMTN